MSNIFSDIAGIVANQGLHPKATIISTKHVGVIKTQFGPKDMQQFVLRVEQFNKDLEPETADIHVQYHRSFSPKASLVPFVAAVGIDARRGMTLDFSTLVGKTLKIFVSHKIDAHGRVHANIEPLVRKVAL
jgi:hypothetical protein